MDAVFALFSLTERHIDSSVAICAGGIPGTEYKRECVPDFIDKWEWEFPQPCPCE
jgi:hypothetical protein